MKDFLNHGSKRIAALNSINKSRGILSSFYNLPAKEIKYYNSNRYWEKNFDPTLKLIS